MQAAATFAFPILYQKRIGRTHRKHFQHIPQQFQQPTTLTRASQAHMSPLLMPYF
jgi:hypothetical protein